MPSGFMNSIRLIVSVNSLVFRLRDKEDVDRSYYIRVEQELLVERKSDSLSHRGYLYSPGTIQREIAVFSYASGDYN